MVVAAHIVVGLAVAAASAVVAAMDGYLVAGTGSVVVGAHVAVDAEESRFVEGSRSVEG